MAKAAATEIMPIPPVCIKSRITTCPKTDQCDAVSYAISPVTQVAEAEVKSASIYGVHSLFFEATGNDKRKLPKRIIPAKPSRIVWKGDSFFLILTIFSCISGVSVFLIKGVLKYVFITAILCIITISLYPFRM